MLRLLGLTTVLLAGLAWVSCKKGENRICQDHGRALWRRPNHTKAAHVVGVAWVIRGAVRRPRSVCKAVPPVPPATDSGLTTDWAQWI